MGWIWWSCARFLTRGLFSRRSVDEIDNIGVHLLFFLLALDLTTPRSPFLASFLFAALLLSILRSMGQYAKGSSFLVPFALTMDLSVLAVLFVLAVLAVPAVLPDLPLLADLPLLWDRSHPCFRRRPLHRLPYSRTYRP